MRRLGRLLGERLPRPPPFPGHEGPLPWPDGRAAGGTLRWTGVAGWRFDLGGVALALDPFVSRPPLWRVLLKRPAPDRDRVAARFAGLDAVFLGHTHYDHALDLPAVAEASPEAVVHGSRTAVALARRLGLPASRAVEAEDGRRVGVGPFTVEAVASAHGRVPLAGLFDREDLPARGAPRTPLAYPRGAVLAWRIEAAGRAFHVQGSAGIDEAALARQAPADVLVACLAARRGTPRYLERLGERLRPSLIVPCHHDDFFVPLEAPPRPVPLLDWAGFLRDVAALRARHGTRLWLPPRDRPVGW